MRQIGACFLVTLETVNLFAASALPDGYSWLAPHRTRFETQGIGFIFEVSLRDIDRPCRPMPVNFDPVQYRPRQPTVRVTIRLDLGAQPQPQTKVIVGYTRLSVLTSRLEWYPAVRGLDADQMGRVKALEDTQDAAWMSKQEEYANSLQAEIAQEKQLFLQTEQARMKMTEIERRQKYVEEGQLHGAQAAKAQAQVSAKRVADPSPVQPVVKRPPPPPTMPPPPAPITEIGHTAWAPAFGRLGLSIQIRGDSYSNQDFDHQPTTGLRALGCPNAANPHHLCTPTCEFRYGFGTPMALLCPEQLQLEALEQSLANADPKSRDEIKAMMTTALALQAQIAGTKAELHALKRFLPQQSQ